jgi:endogenous inhibitor of DNA gyrase (YacG/DUF329 family)
VDDSDVTSEADTPPPGPEAAKPGRRCPICGKPSLIGFYPFCSKRCADRDLNRWLSGAYAIAGAPADDSPETPEERE